MQVKYRKKLSAGAGLAARLMSEFMWQPAFSLLTGSLPIPELPALAVGPGQRFTVAQAELNLETDGKLQLAEGDAAGLTLYIDGQKWDAVTASQQKLAAGKHRLTVVVNTAVTPTKSIAFIQQ